jgi:hypothetical protein
MAGMNDRDKLENDKKEHERCDEKFISDIC